MPFLFFRIFSVVIIGLCDVVFTPWVYYFVVQYVYMYASMVYQICLCGIGSSTTVSM